jgi:gamma-glutamylcyclotransferase (GGCT)/AIG2-like uncharacterized protein YtfP
MNKKIPLFLILILFIIFLNIRSGTNKNKNNSVQKQDKDIAYFAYGSNMNIDQMNNRCPDGFKKIANGELLDYDFGFDKSGYANIKESSGSKVLGLIYNLTKTCLNNLDGYEGYPNHYNRKLVDVKDLEDNKIINSFVYIEPKDQFDGIANQSYLNIIILGAEVNNLPINWINHIKSFKN